MITEIPVKSVLNKKKKRDAWFLDEYTVNAYEGCSMNCLYCYVRGSKYGENMTEKLSVKINAAEVLEKQLQFRVKKNQYGIVAMSSATDAYMPLDETYGMTQKFLQLFLQYRFPVHIITKSERVMRDIEILKQIDKQAILPEDLKKNLGRGVIISFSISTLEEKISNRVEPGAIVPTKRLETMKYMKEKGFLVGLNCMPLLPYLSDSEEQIEEMITTAKNFGADYVLIAGLTLFGSDAASSKVLFRRYLEKYYPHLVQQYKSLYRIYPFPPKSYHENINSIVKRLCEKHGIRNSIL